MQIYRAVPFIYEWSATANIILPVMDEPEGV